jgi:hypothetical protein
MAAASAAIAALSRYSKPPPLGGGVFTSLEKKLVEGQKSTVVADLVSRT